MIHKNFFFYHLCFKLGKCNYQEDYVCMIRCLKQIVNYDEQLCAKGVVFQAQDHKYGLE